MPVNTPCQEYLSRREDWRLVRDCIAGEGTIKGAGEIYLPKLHKQELKDFQAYVFRACFMNATARVQEAAMGLLFRKPPTIKLPPALNDVLADADLNSAPFMSYARQVAADVVSVGRAGTLIEYSLEEARPYCALYCAEAILAWEQERVEGKMMLSKLILQEQFSGPNTSDEFSPITGPQWRVLRLTPEGVTWEIWKAKANDNQVKEGQGGEFERVDGPHPMVRRGEALDAIPFVFHNSDAPGCGVSRAPLADLAHINVSHYRTSADLENGRHVCGIPTPYAIGFGKGEFYLGTNYVWASENADASCGFLEFLGTGLDSLSKALEEKAQQMAALGARIIEPRAKDAEAYETVVVKATAEASTLSRVGLLCTESLTEVLAWCNFWLGTAATMEDAATGLIFTLNKDFVSSQLTPQMLDSLVSARQQNIISAETLFYQLQRGEIIEDSRTLVEEQDSIDANPPMPTPIPIDPNKTPPVPVPGKKAA